MHQIHGTRGKWFQSPASRLHSQGLSFVCPITQWLDYPERPEFKASLAKPTDLRRILFPLLQTSVFSSLKWGQWLSRIHRATVRLEWDQAHISAEWLAAAGHDISRAGMTPWKAVPPEQTRSTSCTWATASFLLKICHELFLSISFPNPHATTQNMTISCLPKSTHSSDSEDKPIPTILCTPLTSCLCLLFSLSFLTWSNLIKILPKHPLLPGWNLFVPLA